MHLRTQNFPEVFPNYGKYFRDSKTSVDIHTVFTMLEPNNQRKIITKLIILTYLTVRSICRGADDPTMLIFKADFNPVECEEWHKESRQRFGALRMCPAHGSDAHLASISGAVPTLAVTKLPQ